MVGGKGQIGGKEEIKHLRDQRDLLPRTLKSLEIIVNSVRVTRNEERIFKGDKI